VLPSQQEDVGWKADTVLFTEPWEG
jgi:hypothetical protein